MELTKLTCIISHEAHETHLKKLCIVSDQAKMDLGSLLRKGRFHLLELALTGTYANFPAVIDFLTHPGCVLILQIQPHIVLEGLDRQLAAVQVHLQTNVKQATVITRLETHRIAGIKHSCCFCCFYA